MGEFPLVIFTVLSQMAVGAAITLFLLDYSTDRIDNPLGKKITLMILGMTGVGLAFSLLHLGHPLEAYRALTNLGSSWLSREVVLFSLFAALLIAYYLQWKEDNSRRKTIGIAASVTGLLAVFSSGMVYVLPAVPAWNNFSPVVFYLLTAAVLGPLFIITVLKLQGVTLPSSLIGYSGVILASYLLCFILYTSVLLSSGGASGVTAGNMLANNSFVLRIILTWIIPLGFLVWVIKKSMTDYKYLLTIFMLVFLGEIIGRYLFYSTAVILKIAAF